MEEDTKIASLVENAPASRNIPISLGMGPESRFSERYNSSVSIKETNEIDEKPNVGLSLDTTHLASTLVQVRMEDFRCIRCYEAQGQLSRKQ